MDNTAAGDWDVLEKKLHGETGLPISVTFEFLEYITCNFSNDNELGQGTYGKVYKGVLSNKIIAVKKLFEMHLGDDEQFQKEVTNVMGINHKNIVRLVGYCAESKWEAIELSEGRNVMAQMPRRLLCFEYIPNKSLDKHLSDESCGLDWSSRYKIIQGICSGLHFLYEKDNIVHLDLKPQNILLDDELTPKIADFGLSWLLGAKKSQTVVSGTLRGTLGYMAPEILQGTISHSADVFSFGVIMLEIITGLKEHPIPYLLTSNEKSSCQSVQQYKENVLRRWTNVFQNDPKYQMLEHFIKQVEECITLALMCLDCERMNRPTACDIFERLTGEICLEKKKRLLISACPSTLCFNFKDKHMLSFSELKLTNETDDDVAFRIVRNNWDSYFLRPVHGLVKQRSERTIRIAMWRPPKYDNQFTIKLQCTKVGNQYQLPSIEASDSVHDYNHFFTEANNEVRDEKLVRLLFVIVHEVPKVPRCMIDSICVHPTKTWILMFESSGHKIQVLDYKTQETVPSSEFSALVGVCAATFIPRKQWFVSGFVDGYIKAYSYETMQEVKSFIGHSSPINSFDIHPTEPYMLSACYITRVVKLWNWEKDWECVKTIDTGAMQVKFDPKYGDYFACTTLDGFQIWNIASRGSDDLVFTVRCSGVFGIDYLTCGEELYLTTGHDNGSVKVWDWRSRSCLTTIKEHKNMVSTVCAHPVRPILITGSWDGTVCLWNSVKFELEGKLNCELGGVNTIVCLKGWDRIAIGHNGGLAITEI